MQSNSSAQPTQSIQSTQSTQPVQLTQLTQDTVADRPAHPNGLHAKWETVNGKLVCRWFKDPD